MSRFRFAILACSASKAATARPARELYTGALFRQSLALAELQAERVLILSAKHGVVEASQVLEPYDQQLPTEKHRREQWGEQVALKLVQAFGITSRSSIPEGREVGRSVLCLAPQSYVKAIGHLYGVDEWSQPLRHLGIGQQKRKLAELLAVKSTNAVADHLRALARKGLTTSIRSKGRTLAITNAGRTWLRRSTQEAA